MAGYGVLPVRTEDVVVTLGSGRWAEDVGPVQSSGSDRMLNVSQFLLCPLRVQAGMYGCERLRLGALNDNGARGFATENSSYQRCTEWQSGYTVDEGGRLCCVGLLMESRKESTEYITCSLASSALVTRWGQQSGARAAGDQRYIQDVSQYAEVYEGIQVLGSQAMLLS